MSHSAIIALACLASLITALAADNMKAFPAPADGMSRFVVTLPAEANEGDLKVEVVIGKTVQLEPSNRYFFGGKIETKVAQGWGFTYYLLPELGPMGGTLMGVDANAAKVERFVPVAGEPLLLRYNSKLPVVVYVPDGVEVRYRIWRAPADCIKASKG